MKKILVSCFIFLLFCVTSSSQQHHPFFSESLSQAAANPGELRLAIESLSFFKDNEFTSYTTKGYSLPGFWIRPKVTFQALDNVRLEAGLQALHYWGANKYPSLAYSDIALWKGDQYQKGFHILPWFRVKIDATTDLKIILGDLYGGVNHQLIEPLYNPELSLTADPEIGFQILYDTPRFHFDSWINWQSFIFDQDGHKEAFTVGLSSRLQLRDTTSRCKVYLPLQALIQHRGGELDTIFTNSVQTLMNGTIGIGMDYQLSQQWVDRLLIETAAVGYYQQSGHIWPIDKGWGLYAHAKAYHKNLSLDLGYFDFNNFASLFGSPLYGSVSQTDNTSIRKSGVATALVEYHHTFGQGFTLGTNAKIYYRIAQQNTSFSAGIYFKACPSFLLKKFDL